MTGGHDESGQAAVKLRYSARILHPTDARMTFPLAALKRPDMSLDDWRKLLRRKPGAQANRVLIGIANAAGCVVAVLHWNGIDFDTLASAPSFMMDETLIRHAARSVLEAAGGDSAD